MRIALLADIHGNLPALHAVQLELERLQPDYVVLNGDLINGTPFSHEVIHAIRPLDWLVIRGNHEFYYLNFGTERASEGSNNPKRWGQLHWLVEQLRPEDGQYLAMLPDERTFYLPGTEPIRIAHGVPGHNRIGFYLHQADEEIRPKIEHVTERTLISAHTHVQIDRQICSTGTPGVESTWHLINPGSAGLPLNGNVQAQFAVVESVSEEVETGGWRATHYGVDYDRRPVLEAFRTSGMIEAGGTITQLFYWEICTAEPEIIHFYRWCWKNGTDPDDDIQAAFETYIQATGRDQYIQKHDPSYNMTAA